MEIKELIQEFINIYGGDEDGIRVFASPGRVNLIGEHTDYNGGFVFQGDSVWQGSRNPLVGLYTAPIEPQKEKNKKFLYISPTKSAYDLFSLYLFFYYFISYIVSADYLRQIDTELTTL